MTCGAVQVLDAAEEALRHEERTKDQLCQACMRWLAPPPQRAQRIITCVLQELNLLVQQSAAAQIEKLDQLTQRLEYLNKVRLRTYRTRASEQSFMASAVHT